MKTLMRTAAGGILGLLALSSCALPSLPDGTLRVVHQCAAADTVTVYVDGSRVGTVNPRSSADFALEPGDHSATAMSGNGLGWPQTSFAVVSGGTVVRELNCGS